MIIKKWKILEYCSQSGGSYFRVWLESLSVELRARVQARIFRIENGNLGDFKNIGHGIFEFRLAFGAGYRIYFGFDSGKIIILLCGGDKAKQHKDILRSRDLWLEYLRRAK